YHAADANPLDAGRLGGIPESKYAGLRFLLQPSCQLLESHFPVDRIWEANQPGNDGSLDADPSEGCRLVIHRQEQEVRFFRVSDADFRFLHAIADGATLEEAYVLAASGNAAFDATAALTSCLSRGLFRGLLADE